jgi:hypothetical protein
VAVKETSDTIYLVLPSTSVAGREDVELSDPDLESVAGGDGPYDDRTYTGESETCVWSSECVEVIH